MTKLSLTKVLSLALGCATAAFASPFTPRPPGALPLQIDVRGAIVVNSDLSFSETGWEGTATHLGAVTWEAFGQITVTSVTGSLLDIEAQASFTMTAANGDVIYGTFQTTGTFDVSSLAVDTTGTFELTGGTGRFAGVQGAGIAGATGTAPDAACLLPGWIEY